MVCINNLLPFTRRDEKIAISYMSTRALFESQIVTSVDMMETMRNGPLLLIQSFRVFINSWIGQRLIDRSTRIPEAA